ncbi:receptor-type tyrosine-protein phosphatase S-like [Periophthalmus magnuspinnatus]|uniref:receptor-type tyrosine-protein phosphatase S-like n=1 Tax=Periophthalmus magnuspinnatus TaxID=409849 RepID=UPI0024372FF1|nr:receptor-type tyrosine-protein phosphatase S-like [Periophthalmus magnuspinnatus]
MPSFIQAPEDQTGVSGGVASFVCQASGEPKPRITWMKKGKKVSSQRFEVIDFDDGLGSVLRIQPLRSHRDEAVYECTIANSVGGANASARLIVLEEDQIPHGFPTIDMGPQLKVVERTRTATLLCAASGAPDPEIQWYKDFLPVDISSSDGRVKQLRSGALQIENSEESDQGKYECVATNNVGTRYSAPANLYVRVRRVPPRFSIPPSHHEVMPGGSLNLTCVAVGAPMPFVKWVSEEAELTQQDQMPIGRNVLELTDIQHSANYTCIATSSLGTIHTTAQVSVKALPQPPTGLTVTETTATSVTLSWDSGNPDPILYYVIQYKARGSEGFQEVEGVASTRYSIGGLSPFSEYDFRVMAVNSVGRGPLGATVSTRTSEQVPSSPPLRVLARMLSSTTMLVQWEPPEEPNGQIQGYRVLFSPEEDAPLRAWQSVTTNAELQTILSELTPQLTYSLRVLAFTTVGDGPLSDTLRIKAQQGVPSLPVDFQGEAELDSQVMLSWMWPVQDQVISYELQYWEAITPARKRRVELEPVGSYAVEGLKPDTLYCFSLAARSHMGLGLFTLPIEVRTARSMPAAPPRKVEVQPLNSTALRVTWNPPIYLTQHGQIRGYQLIYAQLDHEDQHIGQAIVLDVSEAQEAIITGLQAQSTYSVTVAAYTTEGQGAPSMARLATTMEAVPGRPTMISTTISNTALIQWQPPQKMVGELMGYQLQYKRKEENAFTIRDFKPTDDHFTVTGLHKGATYIFKLCIKNQAGYGEEYVKEISIPEDVPGSYPQNLTVVGLSSTSTELSWDPPPLAQRNGRIVQYVVVYRDINSQSNSSLSTSSTRMSLNDLQPDTTYDIRVQAFTSRGGGPLTPSIQSRTLTTSMPAFIKNFAARRVTTSSVLLKWEVSENYKSQVPLKIQYGAQGMDVPAQHQRVCIGGLQADTEYTFVLSSLELQQQVSVRTAPLLFTTAPVLHPQGPKQRGTLALSLPHPQGTVRWFYIVVVPVPEAHVDQWTSPDAVDLDELLERSRDQSQDQSLDQKWEKNQEQSGVYVAARLDALPAVFTLGDGNVYSSFYNHPLRAQQLYRCFVLAELEELQCKTLSASPFSELLTQEESPGEDIPGEVALFPDEAHMLWVMGPVFSVILIIFTVITILVFKRKRTCPSLKEEPLGQLNKSVQAPYSDPVEMRRVHYPTPGIVEHPPVPLCDLAEHIKRLKANDNLLFSQEFESIDPGQDFTWQHSNLEVNKPKNRYANVIAYDHTRVVLSSVDGVLGSDYINANYIDGYRKQNAYIATQGPLLGTLGDFWRMVWEQNVCTIVMMTRLEENSRIKCEQYWPSRGTETYGIMQVSTVDTVELATYSLRTFTLHKNGCSMKREVRQFQFVAWPDHGVPEYPTHMLGFLCKVRAWRPPDGGPIVVHCSAGVGRTGCFIAIDAMLERMKHQQSVDIYGHVTCMRAQRNYMIQTEEQYVFIHNTALDAAICGHTEVAAHCLHTHVHQLSQPARGHTCSPMQLEFKKLSSCAVTPSTCITASLLCNKSKNRLLTILPFEPSRVSLQPLRGMQGSDYINASFIDGYRQQRAYIATQGPLADTTEDFWRMLWEHNSTIVVMLTRLSEMGREKCHQYWPTKTSARSQYFLLELMAEYNMPQYILREFKVTDTRNVESRTIRQFHFTGWPEQGVPKTAEDFIDFIGQVHKTKEQFGQDGPITVHCSAGVGRTGVFVALSIVLERLRYEAVVDVFQTVKVLRTQRPDMVQTEEQYQFCYRAALEYVGTFDHCATWSH